MDEFRDKNLVDTLIAEINQYIHREYTFMEVCGSHTEAIHKFGIPSLLPPNIKLISGPGCPVCVTSKHYIDKAITYSHYSDTIITTFGDLLRVPGSHSTLEKEQANSSDIRVVYTPLDALTIARKNPEKKVIFLGVGFETTAPGTAVVIKNAFAAGIKNFFVFSAHKIMPPAMRAIIDEGVNINGYICPGHVSTVTGTSIYEFIPEKYGLPCVISGFEPTDILQSILMLLSQIENNRPAVEIQYKRVVKPEGNPKARHFMEDVFQSRDEYWRGFGQIEKSGLCIKEQYKEFNIEQVREIFIEADEKEPGCICGDILKGLKTPLDCRLFGNRCTPLNPVGACMVSREGACQTFYKYKQHEY
jgi:hydrogenase expression/formation protein HypD